MFGIAVCLLVKVWSVVSVLLSLVTLTVTVTHTWHDDSQSRRGLCSAVLNIGTPHYAGYTVHTPKPYPKPSPRPSPKALKSDRERSENTSSCLGVGMEQDRAGGGPLQSTDCKQTLAWPRDGLCVPPSPATSPAQPSPAQPSHQPQQPGPCRSSKTSWWHIMLLLCYYAILCLYHL